MPDEEDVIFSSDSVEGASPAHYLTFVSQRTFPISELQPGNRFVLLNLGDDRLLPGSLS